MGMAVDAMKIASKVDVVILATGDGDFIPLVEYLKTFVQVEVISFGKSSSSALRAACDDFIDMSEEPEKYLIGFKNSFKNKNKNTSPILQTQKVERVQNVSPKRVSKKYMPEKRPLRVQSLTQNEKLLGE